MPTFEQIQKFSRCWSESRLRERAKLWPTPLTWEWFLGDRCRDYSRAECVEFLSVAVAFVQAERVRLPMPPRDIWNARVQAEKPVLLAAMRALGEYLDLWELGDREPPDEGQIAALEAFVNPRSSVPETAEKPAIAADGGGD